MSRVIVSLAMSLDGFSAGPDISEENPMGKNGMLIHKWLFDANTETDKAIATKLSEQCGAVITGNHTYSIAIDGPWGGESPFDSHIKPFVLTKEVPKKKVDNFTYVTDGIESALQQAKAAANSKDVWIMGGPNVVQQYIKAGLVDELLIQIAPVLLGDGLSLFDHLGKVIELKNEDVVQTPGATHIRFSVIK